MKIFVYLFASILYAQVLTDLAPGKRQEGYRVWVYFDEKDQRKIVDLDPLSQRRREKHNLYTPTKHDYLIKDAYIDAIKRLGVKIKNQSRWLNAVSVIADLEQITIIKRFTFVTKVTPIYQHKKKKPIQSHQNTNQNRNLDYGNSQNQIEQINCHIPHIAGYFGQGVRVLYLDTGYELNHEAYDSLSLIAEYDFINDDQNTSNENTQEVIDGQDDHGTICLSVMAGYAPGNLIGPAFKSEYLLAKTEIVAEEIQQEEDNYVAALEWGEALGADIACASLGYLDWYSYNDLDGNTATTTIAVDIASSLGVLCVNSAGNEGDDPWYYIITPSDADSVISVGAVLQNGEIANFSSRGPTYDGRIKPEVCAQGASTYCIRSNTENSYRTASGTSFSAPLVAGAAAVILSANPEWTNMQVREALLMTASNSNTPDNTYGYGIINTWDAINYQHTVSLRDNYAIPNKVRVNKAFPNPFNPFISIAIETISNTTILNTSIYDMNGKLVKVLYKDNTTANTLINLIWDSSGYANGIYFIYTNWPGGSDLQKVTLLK